MNFLLTIWKSHASSRGCGGAIASRDVDLGIIRVESSNMVVSIVMGDPHSWMVLLGNPISFNGWWDRGTPMTKRKLQFVAWFLQGMIYTMIPYNPQKDSWCIVVFLFTSPRLRPLCEGFKGVLGGSFLGRAGLHPMWNIQKAPWLIGSSRIFKDL